MKFGKKGVLGKFIIKFLNRLKFRDYPRVYRKYEKIGFQTPSGKVELFSQRFQDLGLDPLPVYREPVESPLNEDLSRDYPLVLTTGAKTRWYIHSQMRNIKKLNKPMPQNLAEISRHTAEQYGISDGEKIKITTPRGSVHSNARVSSRIMTGVVQLYHGFSDSNANILTDDQSFDPITGSVPLRSELCQIKKAV
jgi:anaerobic selenocysteine-containing dehydrogenase